MKRLWTVFFLAAGLILPGRAFSEPNPELIEGLNAALILEIKSLEQAAEHSETFNIFIPYQQVLMEKQDTVRELSTMILELGGALEKKHYPLDIKDSAAKACNSDAAVQLELVRHYDDMLSRFGHPKAAAMIKKARNQAMLQFMLLTNKAQELILR